MSENEFSLDWTVRSEFHLRDTSFEIAG